MYERFIAMTRRHMFLELWLLLRWKCNFGRWFRNDLWYVNKIFSNTKFYQPKGNILIYESAVDYSVLILLGGELGLVLLMLLLSITWNASWYMWKLSSYKLHWLTFICKLVETARLIMVKRNETGHIRPCHIRESYRKSKLQGKVIRRSVPRLSAKSESDSEKDKIITSFFFVQDKSLYLNLRFLKAKPINIWIVLFSVLLYKCAGTIRIKKTNRPVRKWKHSLQITTQENRHK